MLLLAMVAGATPTGSQTVSNHHMLKLSRNVAFFNDNGPGWTGRPLVRWTGPIIGFMEGGREFRPRVLRLFKEFSKMTGLPFKLVDRRKGPMSGYSFCKGRRSENA